MAKFITQKQFEAWLDGFDGRAHPCPKGGGCPIVEASDGAIGWVNAVSWGRGGGERGFTTPAWASRFIPAIDRAGRPWRTLTAARIRHIYEQTVKR